jgi:hypothetical protein
MIDASIWMQFDLHEQERRLVARDGDSPAQQQHIDDWLAEELPLLLREPPWHKATIIVAGTTHLDYEPNTEIRGVAPNALRVADHRGDRLLQNVQYPRGASCRSRRPSSRSKTTTARTTAPAMAAASNAGNTMPTTAATAAIRATTVIAKTVLRRGDSRSLLSESAPGAGTAVADAIVVSGR